MRRSIYPSTPAAGRRPARRRHRRGRRGPRAARPVAPRARPAGRAAGGYFALRFFEGYGNAEIAEMLGMSRVLVAVTVHRVRARLEKEMREWVRQA